MDNFLNNAKGFTKNPLGIIALFISLIYGFCCLVLSTNMNNLKGAAERIPLIYFVILFPILILAGFMYLVITNHQKLYAPSDFKDEANFFYSYEKSQTVEVAIHSDTQDQIIDSLLTNGSIKGLYALYAVVLAKEFNLRFTLNDLSSHSNLLTEDYTHAFLVATSSIGVFNTTTVEQPFSVSYIHPRLTEKIKSVCYVIAENSRQEDGTTYLYEQLTKIERAFKNSIHKNTEADDVENGDTEGAAVA